MVEFVKTTYINRSVHSCCDWYNVSAYRSFISFTFISFNAKDVSILKPRSNLMIIQGPVTLRSSTVLKPNEGEKPLFSQLFIYDDEEAMKFRLKNKELTKPILKTIQDELNI